MIVAAKVRIEHYLSKQKLTIHYTIYFCHEGCLPSQIFGLLLPISPKSRSNVALLLSIHSRQWVCLEGKMLWGHAEKNRVYSRAYSESICHEVLWQIPSELLNFTLEITPASKFASLELTTREAKLPATAPTGKAANDSRKSAQKGLEGFAFSLLVWRLFTFCHWLATSSKYLSRVCVCQKFILFSI